jgi:hypothetical protein
VATSPTARTRTFLKANGIGSGIVEKWIPQTKRRQDLLGWIDVVAVVPIGAPLYTNGCDPLPHGIYGIQTTSGPNAASRVAKLLELKPEHRDALMAWLETGCLEVWSWSKRGAAGKRKLWTLKRRTVTLSDFVPQPEPEASCTPEKK